MLKSKYGSNTAFKQPLIAPVVPEQPVKLPATVDPSVIVPGASAERVPIIPNIKRHERKPSGLAVGLSPTLNGETR